jgi:type IV pilus assembly protein PilV
MRDAVIRQRLARGFTLVEALVALVVLSVGLLGIAGLQLTSLKANHGSATRTQAVYLTYDIIDRMRANRQAAMDGAYNIAVDADPAAGTVAGDDLVAWRQNISNALPVGHSQPSGSVAFNPATKMVTVQIVWDDSHANVSSTVRDEAKVTFAVTTQLSN